MITLCSNESVVELYSLMKNNGREQMAEELASLAAALDSAEEQYSALRPFIQAVKEQSTDPSGQILTQMAQEELEKILDQFSAAKENVLAWDRATVEKFKQEGVSALDAPFSGLDTQNLFDSIKEQLQSAIGKLRDAIQQEGGVRAAILSSLLATDFAPPEQDRTVARNAATRLNHAADCGHGKQEKFSVRQKLEQKKADIPAVSVLKQDRKPKEAER